MKKWIVLITGALTLTAAVAQKKSTYLNDLSADLLYTIKVDQPYQSFKKELESFSYAQITDSLKSDAQKKAFWINVYNAYTQLRLQKEPQTYSNRYRFFKKKFIEIGGESLSLNDVEHRILRRQHSLLGGGYLRYLFKKQFANDWQVDSLDSRIHFALNCGAKSCPPIAFFEPETINEDLDVAQRNFLKTETEVDTAENVVRVPKILSWYRGDFGGKKGVLELLSTLEIIDNPEAYRLKFRDYNWEMEEGSYVE